MDPTTHLSGKIYFTESPPFSGLNFQSNLKKGILKKSKFIAKIDKAIILK